MKMPVDTPLICDKAQSCPRDRERQSCRHEQPHSLKPDFGNCQQLPCWRGFGGTCVPCDFVIVQGEKELLEPMPGEADAAVRRMLDWWLDYLDGAVDISNERELP